MDKLTIEECEAYANAIVGEDFDAPKLLPVRIAQQLADTMRENERLRRQLENSMNVMIGLDKTGEVLLAAEIYDIRQALSNKD